jgi:RNA polymerase sigma-70 factor (ECF subfamily)
MNAMQLSLAGSMADAQGEFASESVELSLFRRLLDEVWRESESRLGRLAVGMGLHGDQAADVVQDVYLTAIQDPPAIETELELVRWLFRVTVNRCHLEHRSRGRWGRIWALLARTWQNDGPAADAASCGELKDEVTKALATLANDDRLLVAMRYFSDLNSRQIAEIVGRPEATIRGRLRAARRKLAEELAEWNDEK